MLAAADHSAVAMVRALSMAYGAVCFALDGICSEMHCGSDYRELCLFRTGSVSDICTWIANLLAPNQKRVFWDAEGHPAGATAA